MIVIFKKLKQRFSKIRYGGILDIVDEQIQKINDHQQISINLYNALFDERYSKRKYQSVYHGPIQELKNCKVITAKMNTTKISNTKDLIEIPEVNGFNSMTYYWYFLHEAKLIFNDIDKIEEKVEGELYIPKSKQMKIIISSKTIKPKGKE